MSRLKHAVAALVVLSALRRFSDEEYIVRSFRGRDGPVVRGDPAAARLLPPSAHNVLAFNEVRVAANWTKVKTARYIPGEFCPFCVHGVSEALCHERVAYMVQRYNLNVAEVLANADVVAKCTAPAIQHNTYAEEDEPVVILHAGPHKTGTTALQNFLYDSLPTLIQDKLRVPTYHELPGGFGGEGVGLNLAHCCIKGLKTAGGDMNAGMCRGMRKDFPKFVLDAYNKSQNILIVAEDLDRAGIDFDLLRFYLQPYKRIRAVVTYRRLHDWLPSWYNQIVMQYSHIYAKGELKYPSIVEWLHGEYNKFLEVHAGKVAERYASYDFVESVHVINMHGLGEKSIEYFFCRHLQAEHTCQAINEGTKPSKSNIGSDHEYERLAIAARIRGKITTTILGKGYDHTSSLYKATHKLKRRAVDVDKLARICPSEALLKKIIGTEAEQEAQYFPAWHETQGGVEGLRQSFDRALKAKLCSLDVERILDSGVLDDTFKEINAW